MRFIFSILLAGLYTTGICQSKLSRKEYIELYKDISMEEMKRSGVPASITLAQGIIESGDGNSRLATKANNHFGIKCHDWTGPSIKHDDDAKNECFRKYKNPEESYKDHTDFLLTKKRYAFLFEYESDDYKNWARGLKKAGYATSSSYAKSLIKVIEENELYIYDQMVLTGVHKSSKKDVAFSDNTVVGNNRKVYYNNRVKYILADSTDTFESLAEELYMMSWQLPRYNEMSRDSKLSAGDRIYLQPKRSMASVRNKTHQVKEGETLHDISQQYGIKEEKLRERNNIPENAEPNSGVIILLRGRLKERPPEFKILKNEKKPDDQENERFKLKEEKDKQDDEDTDESPEFEIEYDLGS